MLRFPFLFVILLGILLLSVLPTNAGRDDNFSSVGWLSAYHPERSKATLDYRYSVGNIQRGHDAYIAVADCSLVGHSGTLRYLESGKWLRVQVFDCSGADGVNENGVSLLTVNGYVAELDSRSAEIYGYGTEAGRVALTIAQGAKYRDK